MTELEHSYRLLTEVDRQKLRLERIRFIEADLFRAFLQLEEALSGDERNSVAREIQSLQTRLVPHYQALGLTITVPGVDAVDPPVDKAGE